ncbi:hypothetical protein E2P64_06345 [Candidatus Bathyarchaeota archaeon]|nr:hypothetical protein E2P64_06345 [Candidatus Bathyarchaeota archaeon]
MYRADLTYDENIIEKAVRVTWTASHRTLNEPASKKGCPGKAIHIHGVNHFLGYIFASYEDSFTNSGSNHDH